MTKAHFGFTLQLIRGNGRSQMGFRLGPRSGIIRGRRVAGAVDFLVRRAADKDLPLTLPSGPRYCPLRGAWERGPLNLPLV